jgi:acetoin:2,6-dichlorophenolindophenol oxidoreductase subunit beta
MAKTKKSSSPSATETKRLNYLQAINAALLRALEENPEAILFGEDAGKAGGIFGATKELHQKYGDRVFDTPISEAAILGAAVGSAMMGRRPICEIMWMDFTLVALDQIVNQAANVRYVSNGRLQAPMTIRTQQGVLSGSTAQHSQSLEAIFAHVPGLLVGMPATPQDAYDMLLSAVYADDPAIVIEHRSLYFGAKQEVRLGGEVQPTKGARVVKEGSDATLVSWGAMLHTAIEAAETMEKEGVEVEVIDARWLLPFDTATVLESVEKTHRIVIAHEANVSGGFGAEVAARIADEGLWSLDAPICRVGVPDCRIPAAPSLQAALIPDAHSIIKAVRKVMHNE